MTQFWFAVFYLAMIVFWGWYLGSQERAYLRYWWYSRRRLLVWRWWAYINIVWCLGWLVTIPFRMAGR